MWTDAFSTEYKAVHVQQRASEVMVGVVWYCVCEEGKDSARAHGALERFADAAMPRCTSTCPCPATEQDVVSTALSQALALNAVSVVAAAAAQHVATNKDTANCVSAASTLHRME